MTNYPKVLNSKFKTPNTNCQKRQVSNSKYQVRKTGSAYRIVNAQPEPFRVFRTFRGLNIEVSTQVLFRVISRLKNELATQAGRMTRLRCVSARQAKS
jgi:hypothetical protein